MTRPPESLKLLANRLAEVLAEHEGARPLALMQRLGLFHEASPSEASPPAPGALPTGGGPIGIWHPDPGPGGAIVYVRREGEPWWPWADVERIEPKAGRPRVILLGESVARGYFYDPFFNPAVALMAHLRSATGLDGVEVVDLARSDQDLVPMFALMQAALPLEPDAFVIFAGNNWGPYDELEPRVPVEIAALLRQGAGLPGVRQYLLRRMGDLVATFVANVAALCSRKGIPVVLVVPEFNLADWRGYRREVPCVWAGMNERWAPLRDAAEEALSAGRLEEAARLATELIALDEGISAVGPNVLADCHLRTGDASGARPFLEQARDAELWAPVQTTPRCYGAAQQALREHGARHQLAVVDLPRLFGDWLGGSLPGRTLFHDYCHLTVEGIQVAMAGVAQELLRSVWGKEASWRELARRPAGVAPPVAARAHFLAAVHNDSWGQGQDVILHHCARAVAVAPEVAGPMALLADFSSRGSSATLTAAFDELVARGELSVARYCIWMHPFMREKLLAAIVEATRRLRPEVGSLVDAIRKADHGVLGREIDLLQPRFAQFSLDQLDGFAVGAAYYRARGGRSRFLLICEEPSAIRFRLTCRAPAPADPQVTVLVNCAAVQALPLSMGWSTAEFTVAASFLREGLNEVVLVWPLPRIAAEAMRQATERIELGLLPELYPTFGDVYAFSATAARASSSP